ncbi:ArpU family phage packaging/lysis transcriptional regulator [Paenibacillus polymyxa]|uniref:ArpU family phage packaging/lysis transcriptional regulator n=1 Tax=Paenibacillus TaxID=44249 RepID=UPI002AB41206|nr:ArpU family phage packaging/lysis transcriptional regulator [Paenibacillus polymyxa]MDY7993327.1 ArpU family phage packaging/lysis transcriptional regulator [Paenibacillus polymyxa]MDY8120072.1 ArpU family phage packaging/lysis transcriptional regulator [Paenibacillus polymyxa]
MGQQSFLPEIDRKRTQAAVEAALEKYRIYKYLSVEEREASTTAAYSDMPRSSPTNVTSDQTANIAIHNVDSAAFRKEYCERVERAVKRMPRLERFLIEERYMTTEHDYITDQRVYSFVFQPPISEPTYSKIRWRAFYKLALDLKIIVEGGGASGS